ncbi:MAG TPA: phage holin family protein [Thermomicrobiales bacterium]|jgi:putative membrane protein|nr:phage holin family protein [Thermomicrobiales bacterium]
MIGRFVAYAIGGAVAALLVATISQQRLVSYDNVQTVALFAIVIGLLNATIVPVLRFVSFPLTCLTFGLFALAINAGAFALAAAIAGGMNVSFWGAVIGAIVASVASGAIYSVLDE